MKYVFAERDLFKEPNTYMYPPYGGRDFLLAWSEQRLRALAEIESRCSVSGVRAEAGKELEHLWRTAAMPAFEEIMARIDGASDAKSAVGGEGESLPPASSAILEMLWAHPARSLSGAGEECALAMIRRFEISKKLPEVAVFPNLALKNRAPLLSAAPYALFSGILAYRQFGKFSSAELNCLLKVNDLVTSQLGIEGGMEPRHYDALKLGILGELFSVRGLLPEKEYAAF